jgi:3-oxoadipate enol-lactonase
MPDARVNGITLSYQVKGRGEPLLMLGGFNSNRSIWICQIPVFKKYYRIITCDNRGAGRSAKKGPYSVKVMADDAVGLLDWLKISQAHVLGISTGGLIAQELAISYPDRVKRLILACTYSHSDESCGPTPEMLRSGGLPPRRVLDRMLDLTINRRLYRSILIPPMWIKNRLANTESITGKRKTAYEYDNRNRLAQIQSPTLVIAGTADRVIKPASADMLAKLIPDSRLLKIEKGSHLLFIEERTQFNQAVLDFLREEITR